jgi:hypothetical protein
MESVGRELPKQSLRWISPSPSGCKACDGSHPPLGVQGLRWISPSPREGREERAGRAFSFRSIHCGPFCPEGREVPCLQIARSE